MFINKIKYIEFKYFNIKIYLIFILKNKVFKNIFSYIYYIQIVKLK